MGMDLLLKSMGLSLPDMQTKLLEAQNMLAKTITHFDERCKQILEKQDKLEAMLLALAEKKEE